MIYFTRLTLNPASRMVQREISDFYERHRTVMRGFDMPRNEGDVLHRLDVTTHPESITLLIQSCCAPDVGAWYDVGQGRYLAEDVQVKSVDFQLPQGNIYRFHLRANPTIAKVRRDENGKRRNSNRVPLLKKTEQCDWVHRRAASNGFNIVRLQISDPRLERAKSRNMTIFTVLFEGMLQITDATKFNKAWKEGIGPAKAFGCGLLSLARA